jgi:hypothetical protein
MEPEHRTSADNKEALENEKRIEDVSTSPNAEGYIPPEVIQARFELLRDLGPDEMAALNKRVVKKIDWRMMPCVTLMFLMKYILSPISS